MPETRRYYKNFFFENNRLKKKPNKKNCVEKF